MKILNIARDMDLREVEIVFKNLKAGALIDLEYNLKSITNKLKRDGKPREHLKRGVIEFYWEVKDLMETDLELGLVFDFDKKLIIVVVNNQDYKSKWDTTKSTPWNLIFKRFKKMITKVLLKAQGKVKAQYLEEDETEEIFNKLEKDIFGNFEKALKKLGKKFQRDSRDSLRYNDSGEIEFYWTLDDIYTIGLQFNCFQDHLEIFAKNVDTNDAYGWNGKHNFSKPVPWKFFIKEIQMALKEVR